MQEDPDDAIRELREDGMPYLLDGTFELIQEVTEVPEEAVWDYRALDYARLLQIAFRWPIRSLIPIADGATKSKILYPWNITAFSMEIGAMKRISYTEEEEYIYRQMVVRVTTGKHYLAVCSRGDQWDFHCVEGPVNERAMVTVIIVKDKLTLSIPIIHPIVFLAKGDYTYTFRLIPENFDEETDLWVPEFTAPDPIDRLDIFEADNRYVYEIFPDCEGVDFGIFTRKANVEEALNSPRRYHAEILIKRLQIDR